MSGVFGAVFALFITVAVAFGADRLLVATWNVENLFDTSGAQDEMFTPTSWRRWTDERYSEKLDRLAWVIDKMKPDILFVQEIGSRGVLDDLNARIKKNHKWDFAAIGHIPTTDPRIDTAILSRYPMVSTNLVASFGRRGTLVAGIKIDDEVIWCLGNHWKSKIGDEKVNIVARTQEAMLAREEAMKILRKNPNATVIIGGDFNEDCHEPSVTTGLGAVTNRAQVVKSLGGAVDIGPREINITSTTTLTDTTTAAGKTRVAKTSEKTVVNDSGEGLLFYNLLGDVSAKNKAEVPGSYYYARRKVWNTIDTIIVQPRMLIPATANVPGPTWRVQAQESHRTMTFALPQMRTGDEGRPMSYSRQRITGKPDNYYEDGYSDHFPVIVELIKKK